MKIRKPTPAGAALATAALVLSLALVPAALAGKGGGSHGGTGGTGGGGGGCSITPGQVALDQDWTVSAWGLPSNNVNMIITFPDGATSTGPITVASDGTYTTTGNSNMSASWGFIAPEQTGTYEYQFVGRIKWPAGTYNQLYAQCTVSVS